MIRLLITGADSFIGSYLIPIFYQRDEPLLLIGSNSKNLTEEYPKAKIISHLKTDQDHLIFDIEKFKPDVVIHLAGYYTSSDKIEDLYKLIDANLLFLGKILDAVKGIPPRSFIYVGSSTEYLNGSSVPDPAYLYSATKTAGKAILKYYARAYDFKEIIITPYNVYGGNKKRRRIIDLLVESVSADEPVPVTKGEQVLDFIHIDDLVRLFDKIVYNENLIPSGTNFHSGTGKGYTLKKIVQIIEKITKKKANVNWGAIPYRKRDTMYSVADINLQNELLNWQPEISLEKGLQKILKNNYY